MTDYEIELRYSTDPDSLSIHVSNTDTEPDTFIRKMSANVLSDLQEFVSTFKIMVRLLRKVHVE